MKNFTPFEKSLTGLVAEDLAALRFVTEGWYIEYKQEVPNAQSIAKSISAFANSYGGWVFYGIKEESKENSVAGEFLGIEATESDAVLQKIRQAVSNAMNPACHYEARAISGPCEGIGLHESRVIICISVPQSIEAPHVHNKGVIYRRIADGSEPIPETDRYMIEKMFQRSKDAIERYKMWVSSDPELSKGESSSPHLRIMITPNLWGLPRPDFSLSIESTKKALNATEGRGSCLPFDTVYSCPDGIIARQCAGQDPTRSRLTWKLNHDLESDIVVPLNSYSGSLRDIWPYLKDYETGQLFLDSLQDSNTSSASVVDLNYVFNILMGIVESQRELQRSADWPADFYIKIKLLNVWRMIPFLDIDDFIDNIAKHGIPVCLTEECISPPGSHPETFAFIKDHQDIDDFRAKVTVQTIWAFIPIAEAFGIPIKDIMLSEAESESVDDEKIYFFNKLTAAGIRSVNIINKRNSSHA